jgi:hypothetical protein
MSVRYWAGLCTPLYVRHRLNSRPARSIRVEVNIITSEINCLCSIGDADVRLARTIKSGRHVVAYRVDDLIFPDSKLIAIMKPALQALRWCVSI